MERNAHEKEGMIMKYRKKPIIIEAIQWTGDNISELCKFMRKDASKLMFSDDELYIQTLEGIHHASIGDYIIKGVQGEFYPCKPNIFVQTYEACEEKRS